MHELIEEFNTIIKEAEVFQYITRDSELQMAAQRNLEELRRRIRELKSRAIGDQDEDLANLLLGYGCVVDALTAEIEMWLLLKRGEPDEAWEELVAAQQLSIAAARAHEGFGHLVHHHQRLELMEELIFPDQVFMSAGMTVNHLECSICGKEYEDCEHLKGMPYMGEFCIVVVRDAEPDHVAIVKNPVDKGCRITGVHVDGGVRNRMTWRVEAKERTDEATDEGQQRVQATILRSGFQG